MPDERLERLAREMDKRADKTQWKALPTRLDRIERDVLRWCARRLREEMPGRSAAKAINEGLSEENRQLRAELAAERARLCEEIGWSSPTVVYRTASAPDNRQAEGRHSADDPTDNAEVTGSGQGWDSAAADSLDGAECHELFSALLGRDIIEEVHPQHPLRTGFNKLGRRQDEDHPRFSTPVEDTADQACSLCECLTSKPFWEIEGGRPLRQCDGCGKLFPYHRGGEDDE